MYTHVLIPLDGSKAAEASVKEAVRMAPAIRSVHLLMVDEPVRSSIRLDGYVLYVDQWYRIRREMAEDYLRPIAEELRKVGLSVTQSVQFGEAGAAIAKAAENLKVELVLLGGEEGGWFRRPTGLAGLAPRIVRRVKAAVLTVREADIRAAEDQAPQEVRVTQAA